MAASGRVFRLLAAAIAVVGAGAVAADTPKARRIVILGDSITDGNTLAELVHQAFADAGETPPVCINAGVASDTAGLMLKRLDRDVLPTIPGERSTRRHGIAFVAPLADAAVHRNHVGITHFLKVVGRQRGTEAAAAIEYDFRAHVRQLLLHVALDHAFTEVDGAGKVVLGVLALFADIDEMKCLAAVESAFDLIDRCFLDARLGVLDDLKEAWGMMVCHNKFSFAFTRKAAKNPRVPRLFQPCLTSPLSDL